MKAETLKINDKVQLSGMFIYNEKDELLLLHKIKHDHYETPGGKVDLTDCKDSNNPTELDLRNAAIREVFEELGQGFIFEEPEFVKGIDFIKPDGEIATANKFKTKILFGKPIINEPVFDEIKWFSKKDLRKEDSKISPDLKLFLKENLI
ncbi:NUDIX hydrolase [Candidatus Woesearchaeota archaeon]|nr:NUDIX hydrolase [Candidatus Woesearchaeota archaeon]